jgi:Gram-negative bacterial TonB protein C-terminal
MDNPRRFDSFNDTTEYVRLTATQEPFGLTTKAIAAVQSWKFKPARKDGMTVPVRVSVELTFRLF